MADSVDLLLESEALAEARQVMELLEGDGGEVTCWLTLGWFFWYRHGELDSAQERQKELETAIEMFNPCFVAGVEDDLLPAELLPAIATLSSRVAIMWIRPASGQPVYEQLSAAIELLRRAVGALPDQDRERGPMLSNLAMALQIRSQYGAKLSDLDAAISALKSAVSLLPASDLDLPAVLSNLSVALRSKYEYTGRLADLTSAIDAGKRSVDATSEQGQLLGGNLANLAAAQLSLFGRTGESALLDEVIKNLWRAVAWFPPGQHERAGILTNLGVALRERFQRTDDMDDLEKAVKVGRESIELTPIGHPDSATFLSNYGVTLSTRFDRTGFADDLSEAIEVGRRAVQTTPDGHAAKPVRLAALGTSLIAHAGRTGFPADIDEAVEVSREALMLIPPDHANISICLNNLAVALWTQFERQADLAVLDEAVEVGNQALQATPDDHPDLGSRLSNAGLWLWTRYERTGRLADLNEAVLLGERAVEIIPSHPPEQLIALSNLSATIKVRFDETGTAADINRAIEHARAAVRAVSDDHPLSPRLNSNLAGLLAARFTQADDVADLNAAVESAGKAVVAAFASGDPYTGRYLSSFGAILAIRYDRTDDLADLEVAIKASRDATKAAPPDYPQRANYLLNLGNMLLTRLKRNGIQSDADEAHSAFSSAAEMAVARPSTRIVAARAAARLDIDSNTGRAARFLETAVRLLPGAAPRRLGRSDQQRALAELAGLAGDAAALALSDTEVLDEEARAWRALQLLEAGRAFMLNRALDIRTDLSELRAKHPDLATRFEELRDLLELDQESEQGRLGAAEIPGRHRLAEELRRTFERIRANEEFAAFGLPPSNEDLICEASVGPIACFNITAYRCDALILANGKISHKELPDLTEAALVNEVAGFYSALDTVTKVDASLRERQAAQSRLLEMLSWLWDVAAGPVLDAVDLPDIANPRIWWVTGGLLGLLPLHAAGHHREVPHTGMGRRTVMDRVISSYTPTIRALGHARDKERGMRQSGKALVVAMPTTPGIQGRLTHVLAETRSIQSLLPDSVLLVGNGGIVGMQSATKSNVLGYLEGCAIAHFACHGVVDPIDPSQSRLLLQDHRTDPFTVAGLDGVRLDQAGLAYLSACNTAYSNSANLLDEAIHLTSAFQLTGFSHVIGTLWEVDDEISARAAADFYGNLRTDDGFLDLARSPQALHSAVLRLRDRFPTSPSLWASYLHAGA
ncbi:CHAT domain-containing protein [Actinomadura citrea]|uniref:CHAT domain-containing protein n=1 Tax=Actinomadura citrea TaxID=46158 RepID=A0A7Y9KDU7_9ACTN|nr:CHAT domain-containing protein [Actinomadura citrea]NYE15517.1 hypothetical protein [Actinomadura citrea]